MLHLISYFWTIIRHTFLYDILYFAYFALFHFEITYPVFILFLLLFDIFIIFIIFGLILFDWSLLFAEYSI